MLHALARRARRQRQGGAAVDVQFGDRRADAHTRCGRPWPGIRECRGRTGLVSGFAAGDRVLRDPVPEREPGHDWHALPVDEVRRLLPHPTEDDAKTAGPRTPGCSDRRTFALRGGRILGPARDFVGEMRANLADPITPILATGAVASALLGSPFDAFLVSGVLLANAALSAEQQLHAERVLRRLLAVQDPPARRRVGPPEGVATKRSPPSGWVRGTSSKSIPVKSSRPTRG